jgi:hypothetical protein
VVVCDNQRVFEVLYRIWRIGVLPEPPREPGLKWATNGPLKAILSCLIHLFSTNRFVPGGTWWPAFEPRLPAPTLRLHQGGSTLRWRARLTTLLVLPSPSTVNSILQLVDLAFEGGLSAPRRAAIRIVFTHP